MGKSRKRYNWKARQVVETVVENNVNSKVHVELSSKRKQNYDDCNSMVLPSKKRKTHTKKKNGPVQTKMLSNTQRKKLEKIIERKNKKKNRFTIIEALAKVQAPEEIMNKLTSVSHMQTKGLKRHHNKEKKAIKSIKGAYKNRMKLLQSGEQEKRNNAPRDPNIVGFESSSEDSDSSEEENDYVNDKDSEVSCNGNVDKSIINKADNPHKVCSAENTVTLNEGQKVENHENILIENKIKTDNLGVKCQNKTKTETVTKDIRQSTIADCEVVQEVERVPSVFIPVYRDKTIQEARLKLPILGEEQNVMEAIRENSIVLITGATGSGKTTQVPQFLYEAGYASNGKIIGVTEPRRVAATSMSKRVAQELNLPKSKVSYLIRFEGNVTPDTQIKFMTDGVLVKELETDPELSKYSVIILDEAHERSMYTDVLIGYLSRIVPYRNKRGNPLKLIIMSATLRVDEFTKNTKLFAIPPPVVKVETRQFEVVAHYNKQTPTDYVREAYRKAFKIHTKLPDGGILIFLTGEAEIDLVVKKLRAAFPVRFNNKNKVRSNEDKNEGEESDEELSDALKRVKRIRKTKNSAPLPAINLDDYDLTLGNDTLEDLESEEEWEEEEEEAQTMAQPMWVLPLYSKLPRDQQDKVFSRPPPGCRLCVVATNIAETSLTIPNVKYVVDSGQVKTKLYDKRTGVSTFVITWISKASAVQRMGRAGRTSAGHCYRLYSSALFNNVFVEWSEPEILLQPIDKVMLQLMAVGIQKVANFPFPTPPDRVQLECAEQRLILLDILTPVNKGGSCTPRLTPLGRSVSKYPVIPRFAKMLCLSIPYNLINYTIAMVAALSMQEFLVSNDKQLLLKRKQCFVSQGNPLLLGDVMVLLSAVGGSECANSKGELEQFCSNFGLRQKAVLECRNLRLQLTSSINKQSLGLDLVVDPKMPRPTDLQAKQLRQILLAGSVDQVARKLDDRELAALGIRLSKPGYRTPNMEDVIFLSTNSVLYQTAPDWIVYQEIYQTNNMYFRDVTAIEPEWLPIYAPALCNLSDPLTEPPPRYDPDVGAPFCHVSGTFGRSGWTLPVTEIEFPEGLERFKWFAVFFLDGSVCPKLKKYTKVLMSTPRTMVKSWAGLQPRTEFFLKTLVSKGVDSKESLLNQWKEDSQYLLNAYQKWLPVSTHNELAILWPPL